MQSLWMVFACVFFAVAALCVKYATVGASSFMIVFVRGLFGFAMLGGYALWAQYSLKTQHPWAHIRRCVSGAGAVLLYTVALSQLPLATGTTLNYTSSVWLGLLLCLGAWWTGGKLPSKALLACVAAGFGGVVLLLQPSLDAGQALPYALGLSSGLLSAIAYTQVKVLGAFDEPEWRIVFYQSSSLIVIAGSAMALASLLGIQSFAVFGAKDTATVYWLMGNGVLATIGQTALTRAYTKGGTLLTSSLQYLTVVFAAFIGAWWVGDDLTAIDYLAIALIVSSGVAASVLTLRRTQAD